MAHHPMAGPADHPDSPLTVETLLAEPVLRGRLLGGATGLHQQVSWCLPFSEAGQGPPPGGLQADPDLSGIAVHVPAAKMAAAEQARPLIAALARRGAAAVFAWPGPDSVCTDLAFAAGAADGVGLPLVALPTEADYRSIARLVAVKAIAGTAHVLEYSVRVHRTLGEVFATGSGLPALAGAMSTLARAAVLITDGEGEVLAGAGWDGSAPSETAREITAAVHQRGANGPTEPSGLPHAHAQARDVLLDHARGRAHAVAAPVSVAGEVYGTVAVVEPALPADPHDLAQHRVIVEQGAPLIASEMLRQRSVLEAEERARDDFLDTLAHGRFTDVHELEARSRHYRFDPQARHAVFVAQAPGAGARHGQQLLRSVGASGPWSSGFTMAAFMGQLLVVVRGFPSDGQRFDAAAEQTELCRFGEHLHRVVHARSDDRVQIAYGRGARGAAGVAQSYREARIALELSRRVDVPEVCGYERLRVFAAIEETAASAQGRAFSHEILEPLRRADGQTGNLEQVVLAYVAESGNLNAAARRLQLHRNTMLYKLERASRALQMDIRSSETQFTVWLAYRIHTLNDSLQAVEAELTPPA